MHDYETPVIPEEWKDGPRRFARGVIRLMDTLFMRLGRIEKRLRALEAAKEEQHAD